MHQDNLIRELYKFTKEERAEILADIITEYASHDELTQLVLLLDDNTKDKILDALGVI